MLRARRDPAAWPALGVSSSPMPCGHLWHAGPVSVRGGGAEGLEGAAEPRGALAKKEVMHWVEAWGWHRRVAASYLWSTGTEEGMASRRMSRLTATWSLYWGGV